jgi:hypothetical protein
MSQVNDLYFVLLQQLKTKTQNIQINSNTIITVIIMFHYHQLWGHQPQFV